MSKKSFENLTIVSVTGSNDYAQGSIYAIQRSCEELKGAKGLLISPPLPDDIHLPENITHAPISPFGYLEYNLFIIYQLDYFIDTDYCLIVQNDGWVLNGENWRDEFWDYDYIGSPVPIFYEYRDNHITVHESSYYLNNLHLLNDPHYVEPQNGGFSFRSKKLLEMPRKLGIPFKVEAPNPVTQKEMHKMKWKNCIHYEDIFLSALHRPLLEQNGIRFAPSDTALNFGVETALINKVRNKPINETLGFHFCGKVRITEYNRIEFYVDSHLDHIPKEQLREIQDFKLFLDKGYNVRIIS